MAANLKTFGRLLKIYAKMDVLWFLRDTRICLMFVLTDAVVAAADVAGMLLLAGRLQGFGGIARPQLLLMIGYALLVNGLYSLLFANNNAGQISRIIGRGQLDHALVQPVPLPLHFAANGIAPLSGAGPFLLGLGFFGYALYQQPAGAVGAGTIVLTLVLLPLSLAILIAWVYAVSSVAFWAPYAAEEISSEVLGLFTSMAAYPLGGLARLAQLVLCGVLPIGAMAYLPAAIVLGATGRGAGLAFLCAVAAVAVFLSLTIFRKGLKHYAKTSCPRYTGFGR